MRENAHSELRERRAKNRALYAHCALKLCNDLSAYCIWSFPAHMKAWFRASGLDLTGKRRMFPCPWVRESTDHSSSLPVWSQTSLIPVCCMSFFVGYVLSIPDSGNLSWILSGLLLSTIFNGSIFRPFFFFRGEVYSVPSEWKSVFELCLNSTYREREEKKKKILMVCRSATRFLDM